MQKILGKILIPLVRILLKLFFQKIEIINTDNIPNDRPVIFTPNHSNSLIDGMLARTFLPRDPRALAKATLWNNPFSRSLMVASNSIPVYRQCDTKQDVDMIDNQKMFSACGEALANNNSIVLFPEGTSHDDSKIKPLKTGAARIALSAEQQHGPLSLRIVPVGLIFDNKQKLRSRVLIYIGEPIDPVENIDAPNTEDREQVNELTDRIKTAIKSVTLNYPNWEEAKIIKRAADLYVSQQKNLEPEKNLSDVFAIAKQMADAYPDMKENHPRVVTRLVKSVKSYDRLLKVLSIQHEHYIQKKPGIIKTISSIKKLSLFLIRLPLALLGVFLNFIPLSLVRLVGTIKMPTHRKSTAMIFSAVALYPMCWILEANMLSEIMLSNWLWFLLAPVSGVISILLLEHHTQFVEEMITYIRLNTQSEINEELDERLEDFNREISEFIETSRQLEN